MDALQLTVLEHFEPLLQYSVFLREKPNRVAHFDLARFAHASLQKNKKLKKTTTKPKKNLLQICYIARASPAPSPEIEGRGAFTIQQERLQGYKYAFMKDHLKELTFKVNVKKKIIRRRQTGVLNRWLLASKYRVLQVSLQICALNIQRHLMEKQNNSPDEKADGEAFQIEVAEWLTGVFVQVFDP